MWGEAFRFREVAMLDHLILFIFQNLQKDLLSRKILLQES